MDESTYGGKASNNGVDMENEVVCIHCGLHIEPCTTLGNFWIHVESKFYQCNYATQSEMFPKMCAEPDEQLQLMVFGDGTQALFGDNAPADDNGLELA